MNEPNPRAGCLSDGSREAVQNAATEALEKADAITLHRLFKEKFDEVQILMQGIAIFANNEKRPLEPRHSTEDAMLAMRDVALAAIALADRVATGGSKK